MSKTLQWVKASERLPDPGVKEGDGSAKQIIIREWAEQGNYFHVSSLGAGIFCDHWKSKIRFKHVGVEWLEETEVEQGGRTAMGELIEWMDKEANHMETTSAPIMGVGPRTYQLRLCLRKAQSLLPLEQQQRSDDWDAGWKRAVAVETFYKLGQTEPMTVPDKQTYLKGKQ